MVQPQKILVVEDEPELRDILVSLLKEAGYPIVEAEDGEQALEILKREKFGLVLSDIKMPRLSGLDFFERARRKGYQTPFIFVTAFGDHENMRRALKLGARDFVRKPYDEEDILRLVGEALGSQAMLPPAPSEGNFENELMKNIVNSVPHALFVKDYSSGVGRVVVWNSMAELLWGVSASDIIGKSDYDFFPKEQAAFFEQKDREVLKAGSSPLIEEPVTSAKGGTTFVRTWKVVLPFRHDEEPRFILGISQDITEIKKLEREVTVRNQKMIAAERSAQLAEVAREVAHQVNNPLATIMGRSNQIKKLIQKGAPAKEILEAVEKSVTTVSNSVERIDKLVRILTNEQSKTGPVVIPPTKTEEGPFFHDLLNMLAIVKARSFQIGRTLKAQVTEKDLSSLKDKIDVIEKTIARMQKAIEDRRKDAA